jgi:hypothetical protein
MEMTGIPKGKDLRFSQRALTLRVISITKANDCSTTLIYLYLIMLYEAVCHQKKLY